MDASILLVGGDDFLSTLLQRVRNLVGCTVQTVSSPSEAVPIIQAQQPDLIILQGSQPGSIELCNQLKEQAKLAWIYCILVDLPAQTPEEKWIEQAWERESRAEALEEGADAYLCLPLHTPNGQPLGKLDRLEQDRLLRAQILAGLRSVKSHRELVRTNDILSAIALSDPLTELNNRRALDWELPRQIQNARTRSEALSLVMLDVDYFKAINDTYGHPVGDRALQLVSARLRHNLRFRDTLFRYGGEEFVIILSNTDCDESLLVAHRLCRLIGDQPFNIDETLALTITISAGTASLNPKDDPKGASLLKRADKNLLRAKSSGRNRVMGCDEPSIPNPEEKETNLNQG
jgi:two-component system cell cycle response regulator